MGKRRPDSATFADIIADAKAHPDRSRIVPAGLSRDGRTWTDPAGRTYTSSGGTIDPAQAAQIAEHGPAVVYDRCGCGGSECILDWLSHDDVLGLASIAQPALLAGKNGLAVLTEWCSEDGHVLLVVAGEVSWGTRIPG